MRWYLDVSFGDDAPRARKDHGPVNLAALKRHVLRLAKRTSLKTRRFLCGLDDKHLIQTLTASEKA